MDYRILGRTGLRVSLLGIGTGGPSQFGQTSGVSESEIARLVRRALDLGINFFDSAAAYGESEAILGRALRGVPRDAYIVATKFHPVWEGKVTSEDGLIESVERSLRSLNVDTIDLFQLHGVLPGEYREAVEMTLPALLRLQEQGKFRFVGITENHSQDGRHDSLGLALADDTFDTVMVGYNLMNPNPEQVILPICERKDVGAICMMPVRRALSRPEHLRKRIAEAKAKGLIAKTALRDDDPLGWLVKGHVTSLPAAGYKYVAAHPTVSTVLTGTSNIDHLEDNVEAILGPPLPDADVVRLRSIFGEVWEPLAN